MARRISFLNYSEWDADRNCMAFIAWVDRLRIRCLITPEALAKISPMPGRTPAGAYAENRSAVEELARTLIEAGRIDGSEMMIRHTDAAERGPEPSPIAAEPPAVAPIPQPVVAPPVPTAGSGRSMQLQPADCDDIWRALCERQQQAAEEQSFAKFPDLALRAKRESNEFSTSVKPASAHDLNLRRVEAWRMASAWRTELMQRTSQSA